MSLAIALCVSTLAMGDPVGTAFTFQGALNVNNVPGNGDFDGEFEVFDALTDGAQVGSTVTVEDFTVTNGLFTVVLDFGTGVFEGDARFLEIGFRDGASTDAFTTLAPRQELTPTPYALSAGRLNLPLLQTVDSNFAALAITAAGTGNAIVGTATGSSNRAGSFTITDASNAAPAIFASTDGTGRAAEFRNTDSGNTNIALFADHFGTGTAGHFQVSGDGGKGIVVRHLGDVSNNASKLLELNDVTNDARVSIDLRGRALFKDGIIANSTNASPSVPTIASVSSSTINRAGSFLVTNSSNNGASLYAETSSTGTGKAAEFAILNTSNSSSSLFAHSFGTGNAALFLMNGTGTGLRVQHFGASGDIAIFQDGAVNRARIDLTGKGFFNGGTQNSGADVSEAFEVEGKIEEYGPGDVLAISTLYDRRVARSAEPYSTLVAGVYATRPGVLLTERTIDADLGDMAPVGVVGVIPTKVTSESGAIRRGDLLVTSSTAGHAMKGVDRSKMLGAILGKALENYDGPESGVIKVLVNVK
jgi:hypothetical protein